ncbi:MAG: peptidoglycan D,D-transpeptidase FtsI family protein [Candidatus Competibacterales bacterium]
MKRLQRLTLSPVTRRRWLLGLMGASAAAVVVRAAQMQLWQADFYRRQGRLRHLRSVAIPAHRGVIIDRQGHPLAVSSPMGSLVADPRPLKDDPAAMGLLADLLGLARDPFMVRLRGAAARLGGFIYLKRHLPLDRAQWIEKRDFPGVYLRREYRRYYPDGEVIAHLLGFTDIDDRGQEGLEYRFDAHLKGEAGHRPLVIDSKGRAVASAGDVEPPRAGSPLALSIDRRVQYAAYRALKAGVKRHRAVGGTAVVLDVDSGELLAVVNQPGGNPNDRRQRRPELLRNRAVTDLFEPGSTIKPFTVIAALMDRQWRASSRVDTSPGWMRVGRNTVRDLRDYGDLSLAEIIAKSSNVGITKLALSLDPERLWTLLKDLGFGAPTAVELPGQQSGSLDHHRGWGDFEYATRAFGYGLSATALQLVQAYGVVAANGIKRPLTVLKRETVPRGEQILPAAAAVALRAMLEDVVGRDGTGRRAAVAGYRVAGKTGTVHKVVRGRYVDRYRALFAGFAPASRPRLAAVVVIDEPRRQGYHGGEAAAPVFGELMTEALRLLRIPPDALAIPPRVVGLP